MDSDNRGRDAEDRACHYLQNKGLTLLHRNYGCKRGELDLVMRDADSLVFIEVRYRSRNNFGSAAESVDQRKQTRLTACAQQYLQVFPQHATLASRFDVIAINGAGNTIDWIRNAFNATD